MSSQRPSFAKRDREMKLKDKARAKDERRAARKAAPRTGSGPPIATDEPGGVASVNNDAGLPSSPTTSTAPSTAGSDTATPPGPAHRPR